MQIQLGLHTFVMMNDFKQEKKLSITKHFIEEDALLGVADELFARDFAVAIAVAGVSDLVHDGDYLVHVLLNVRHPGQRVNESQIFNHSNSADFSSLTILRMISRYWTLTSQQQHF